VKAVLISIQPPHTDNIFDLLKGIEWRTKPLPTGKHYCYETKNGGGAGKVIGEFIIWRVKRFENISMIPSVYITKGCVSAEFLKLYSKGRPLYAHFIIAPQKYDKPRELSEFSKPYGTIRKAFESQFITRPPQSWCYVEVLHNDNTRN
jgi:predicted transcriptional regulator